MNGLLFIKLIRVFVVDSLDGPVFIEKSVVHKPAEQFAKLGKGHVGDIENAQQYGIWKIVGNAKYSFCSVNTHTPPISS